MSQNFGVFGYGLLKNNALLLAFLQSYVNQHSAKNLSKNTENKVKIQRIFPIVSKVVPNTTMLGWGRKKSYRRAHQFAKKHDLAILTFRWVFTLTYQRKKQPLCL